MRRADMFKPDPVIAQEEQLRNILSDANAKGHDRALRLFSCWCARETRPRESLLNEITLAEKFAVENDGSIDLETEQKKLVGFAIGATTIGLNHNYPRASSDLAAFQTLSPNAFKAASESFKHYKSSLMSEENIDRLTEEKRDSYKKEIVIKAIDKINELLANTS